MDPETKLPLTVGLVRREHPLPAAGSTSAGQRASRGRGARAEKTGQAAKGGKGNRRKGSQETFQDAASVPALAVGRGKGGKGQSGKGSQRKGARGKGAELGTQESYRQDGAKGGRKGRGKPSLRQIRPEVASDFVILRLSRLRWMIFDLAGNFWQVNFPQPEVSVKELVTLEEWEKHQQVALQDLQEQGEDLGEQLQDRDLGEQLGEEEEAEEALQGDAAF